jgi:hypothetical protein
LYDAELDDSRIDGAINSDFSHFTRCRFGVGEPTQVLAWNTSIERSQFCAVANRLHVSGGAITCSACEGPLAMPQGDFCVASESTSLEDDFCEAMRAAPVCADFPSRPRPVTQDW